MIKTFMFNQFLKGHSPLSHQQKLPEHDIKNKKNLPHRFKNKILFSL